MSGATAKAIRRDLRRAAGEDAVEALENCIRVIDNRILPNIAALQKLADEHESRLRLAEGQATNLADSLSYLHDAHGRTVVDIVAFQRMSLRQRLRWLIMGR